MADKISIEIGLEGDDEVRKSLEDMVQSVDSVKGAAEELGQADATVKVKAEGTDEAKAGIDGVKAAAEELGQTDATVNVKVEGADEAKAGLDGVGQSAGEAKGLLDPISQTATIVSGSIDALGLAAQRMGARMTRSLGPLGILARAFGPLGIAAGIVAGALAKFGDSSADALNKLTVESAKLGLTAQQLDTLQQTFGKLAVAPDALASSLEKLKPLLGGGLMRVGDIIPPSVFTGLQQFIARLESMPDGIQRTKLAIDTLGEALGGQVIAGLQTGTISAQNFAAALGSVTPATQQQIVEAARYQQSLAELSAAWTRLKGTIAPITTPVFNFLAQELNKFINDLKFLAAYWQVVKASLTGGDIGAAAKQAAAEYQNATQALQQTGQAAQQTGQQAAQAGQTAASGFMVWDEQLGAITQKQAAAAAASTQAGATAAQAGQTAASGWDVFLVKLDEIARKAGALLGGGGGGGGGGGASGMAGGGLLGGRGTGTSDSNLAWLSRGEYITPASVVRQPGVLSLLEALRRGGGIPGFAEGGLAGSQAGSIIDSIILSVNSIDTTMRSYASALDSAIQTLVESLRSSFSALDQSMAQIQVSIIRQLETLNKATGLTRSIERNASGGLLGGRGTGTSDSNLAWVSRGEHIMPAQAVRQPGVLEFLELLRRSGGNLSAVLDGMGRFALGGMVPRVLPAFAIGGLAGGSNVTIQFPGLPAIGGLRASSAVVDELRKAAVSAQVRSGGRKPSRYS